MKLRRIKSFSMAVLMAVVLALAGCATVQKIGEAIGVAAEKVCNFSVAESQEAQMAVAFISTAAPIAGAVLGVPITQEQAEEVLTTVANAAQTGACVLLTDLTAALDYTDKLADQYQSSDKGELGPARAPIPDLDALKARLKK